MWHPRRSQGSLRPFLGAGLVIWGAALAVKEAGRGRSGSVSNRGTKQSHGSFRRRGWRGLGQRPPSTAPRVSSRACREEGTDCVPWD